MVKQFYLMVNFKVLEHFYLVYIALSIFLLKHKDLANKVLHDLIGYQFSSCSKTSDLLYDYFEVLSPSKNYEIFEENINLGTVYTWKHFA